ncbi:ribonuclease H-like domain-containing protein, partial [Tanacetum coccineum]
EMNLKWQVTMISMRLEKFYKKTGRKLAFNAKEPVGFDKTKVECFNYHKTGHFARECRSKGNQDIKRKDAENTGYKARDNGRRPANQAESNALVVVDGDGLDFSLKRCVEVIGKRSHSINYLKYMIALGFVIYNQVNVTLPFIV